MTDLPPGYPDQGLGAYQRRNVRDLRLRGERVLSAPPPPYFSFHATRPGLERLEIRPGVPAQGGNGILVHPRAAAVPPGEALHAVYLASDLFAALDLRHERRYSPAEQKALGCELWDGPITGAYLHHHLADLHPAGRAFSAAIQTLGFQGVCCGPADAPWWVLASPALIKWTKLIDRRDLEEITRLERFDPEPMRSQGNLLNHPELRHPLAGKLITPRDLGLQ